MLRIADWPAATYNPMQSARLRILFGGCRPIQISPPMRGIAYVRREIGHGSGEAAEWLVFQKGYPR